MGERNNRVPKLIETARELWKESKLKWLVKVAPLILVLMLSLWCLIRMVLPENEKLNVWLLVAVCFVPLIFNSFKLLSSQRRLKEQTDNAIQLLEKAEEELKNLAEGPEVKDEQLDREILKLKKKVLEAREQLRLKSDDPNDL